jgi:pimeloyl-ACP methyl ester carboxylesterase
MEEGFETTVIGPKSGPLVFFLHGWPDDETLFDAIVDKLSKTHRCVLVRFPNANASSSRVPVPMGPTFAKMNETFEATVERYRAKDDKVILVSHDWGTCIAHAYEQKWGAERVKSMVTLDVGSPAEPTQVRLGKCECSTSLVFWVFSGLT